MFALHLTKEPHHDGDGLRFNGQRSIATWNGTEGVVDLSVQLASVVQHIDPYGEDH